MVEVWLIMIANLDPLGKFDRPFLQGIAGKEF
ncbi:hypothetical protein MCEMSE15_01471 [Fimbriimonadaceae bacterium]